MSVKERLAHAFNAFINVEPVHAISYNYGGSYGARPDRTRLTLPNERSIVSAIYNRIAIDVSEIAIKHVRLDDNGRYSGDINSGLNECLTVEANLDQAATAFKRDAVMTMLDGGTAVLVPIDTSINPAKSASFEILTMRVGMVVQWAPEFIKVSVYNEKVGRREEIWVPKRICAIIENPLFQVMNEPNSTLQRLIRKLGQLDAIDELAASGKLDMIIQLPYVIKSEARKKQAEERRKDIEMQLKGSQYGIAYTDGTEKITQLNRPAENNLLKAVEFLTKMLYGQLGITEDVMNGTADEKIMLNYHNRTIKPILTAMVEAMRRSFLTKTARSQKQSILFFRDPFALVPVNDIAEISDKFTRNEILSSNEIRGIIGFQPSSDPKADELRNSNMPQSELGQGDPQAPLKVPSSRVTPTPKPELEGDSQNGA